VVNPRAGATSRLVRDFIAATEHACTPDAASRLIGIRRQTYLKWAINPPKQLAKATVQRLERFLARAI
jgi:hypothetical protein